MNKRVPKVPVVPLAAQLYEALRDLPRACTCRWIWKIGAYDRDAADTGRGKERVHVCARCAAMERYESEYPRG